MAVKGVNVGCGLAVCELPGWENMDNSPNARLAKYPRIRRWLALAHLLPVETAAVPWPKNIRIHDATQSLPYPDQSLQYVYTSHFLEHQKPQQADCFLGECYRVLAPGGILRVVVPDLSLLCKEYIEATQSTAQSGELAADQFLKRTQLLGDDAGGPRWFQAVRTLWGRDRHFWMYDERSLGAGLERAGFTDVRRWSYGQSLIPEVASLDVAGRASESLYMEGRRP